MEKKGIEYITIAKGIGISLVVLGHCGNSVIEKIVLLFHMPLFFFLSGFLFRDEKLKNPIEYIKKKFLKLYLPYLIYEIIFLLLHNFFIQINIYNTNIMIGDKIVSELSAIDFIKTLVQVILCAGREPIGGALWFLVVLLFVTIMFFTISYILKKIASEKNYENIRFLVIFLIFMCGNLLTKFGFTIPRFNNSLVMLFIYYIGFLIGNYKKNITFQNPVIFIVCVIALLVNNLYGSVSVNNNIYLSPDFLVANTLIGVYIVIFLAKRIEKTKLLKKCFIMLGNNSLHIMCLHFLAFKIVSLLRIFVEGLNIEDLAYFPVIQPVSAWIIAYFLIGLIAPTFFAVLFNKTKSVIKKRFRERKVVIK